MKSATGELGDLGGWAVISLAAMLGAWGGSVVWTGGLCRDCCSPVAKCPKDEVGNGRIRGFEGMGRMAGAGCVAVRWVFACLQVGGRMVVGMQC